MDYNLNFLYLSSLQKWSNVQKKESFKESRENFCLKINKAHQ